VCIGFVDRNTSLRFSEAGDHDKRPSLPPLSNFHNPIANPIWVNPTGNGNGVLIRPLLASRRRFVRCANSQRLIEPFYEL